MNIGKRWLLLALTLLTGAVPASDNLMYRAAEPAELSAGSYTIHLKTVGAETVKPDPSLRWNLKLSGIWASEPPSSTYALYLNLAPNAQPTPQDPGYVGALSTYDIPIVYDPQRPRKISYDLQPVFARLQASGQLKAVTSLTFLPIDPVQAEQHLRIEHVEIYRIHP
ncbi:hypothetical protein Q6A51_14430 [Pseudomonas sp. KFB-139]|uniref:Uncharacterized protein n=1 Tax=Pseudomonas serbiensis TaxID=3064350 RepID=A0ABT9CR70_9PSED|nr:hypothetical protein [Pseudomonas sp. KFB-138]MDO7927989.1 hypothetical protein [Pseudomonas sp. KFB-138]